MNKKLLLFVALFSTVLTTLICLAAGTGIQRAITEALHEHLKETLENELLLATNAVRDSLVRGDIRYARNTISAGMRRGSYYDFRIVKDGEGDDDPQKEMRSKSVIRTEVPIYFNDEKTSRWGSVVYKSSTEKIDRITDQIEGYVWKLTAAISAVVLFSMGFIFLFLGRSATGLTPILENYLRDGTLGKYNSRLEIVWRPLLATLQSTGQRLAELRAETESARVAKAVAGMLRMVAHDVRVPITMTQTVVNMFAKLESGEEIKEIAKECIPELQQAISAVNGTLADVLEIESAAKPVIKNVALDEFIRTELRQALKHAPEKNPQVELAFQHQGTARLDPVKFARVLANIFGNALQLMPNHERIWARTSGLQGGGVLIVLGNGGTSIPQGDLPTIFDSFYSKRQGGTGLGLAIAQKVVTDHGGKIWAESDEGKVEFFIELPHS